MRQSKPFWFRAVLALGLFTVMVPSFIATWQSLSAAVSADGYCTKADTTEAFTYIVQAAAPSAHIAVSRVASTDACAVPAGAYTNPQTPGGTALTVSQTTGVIDAFSWQPGTATGYMGRLVQGMMVGAGVLAVGSLAVLCLQEDQGEDEEEDYA